MCTKCNRNKFALIIINFTMNKLKQIIPFLLIIIYLCSCSKEDSIKEDDIKQEIVKENITKKWVVENSAEFISIEFESNGNYIIIKNASNTTSKNKKQAEEIFISGTYEILDTDILLLSDFGTMKFDDSDPNHIKFSIKYPGSDTYNYELNVTKAAEFTSTPKTDLLCDNTWRFTRKVPIQDTINEINFSKAGTCFTNFSITSQNAGKFVEFGKWKWQGNTETKIIITQLKYTQWMIDRDGEAEFEITKLSGTKLEMKEIFNGEPYSIAFDTIRVNKSKPL
jgi:hypothetical protein